MEIKSTKLTGALWYSTIFLNSKFVLTNKFNNNFIHVSATADSTASILENDPSIIICRNSSNQGKRIMYSLEELLALRNEPVSNIRPNLNDACRNIFRSNDSSNGIISSSGLNQQASQQLSSNANGSGDRDRDGNNKAHQRRSNEIRDPRERLRKEDGIVLSPQRRSFTMGCQMPQIAQSSTTSLGTSSQSNNILRNERENLLNVRDRRIGSGRIIARDVSWDYRPDKDSLDNQDYSGGLNYRNGGTGGGNGSGLIGYRERDRDRDDRYSYFIHLKYSVNLIIIQFFVPDMNVVLSVVEMIMIMIKTTLDHQNGVIIVMHCASLLVEVMIIPMIIVITTTQIATITIIVIIIILLINNSPNIISIILIIVLIIVIHTTMIII